METQLEMGREAKLKFEIKDGKIQISSAYHGAELSAGAFVATTPEQLCHALAEIIPGDSGIEKGVITALRVGLKMAMETSDPAKLAEVEQAAKDNVQAEVHA